MYADYIANTTQPGTMLMGLTEMVLAMMVIIVMVLTAMATI